MGWTAGVQFLRGTSTFLFSTVSKPVVGPVQPSIQWVMGDFSPGVKSNGREADHSASSCAEVKNGGAIPPLRHTLNTGTILPFLRLQYLTRISDAK
jgi:hypothetical protein